MLASFLLPMLDFTPDRRATARDMLQHPWLSEQLDDEDQPVRQSRSAADQSRSSSQSTDSRRPGRDDSRGNDSRSHYHHDAKRSR